MTAPACTGCGAALGSSGPCACGESGSARYHETASLRDVLPLPRVCSCCLTPTEDTVAWMGGRAIGYSRRRGTIREGVDVPTCESCRGKHSVLGRLRAAIFIVVPFSVVFHFGSRDPKPAGTVILAYIGASIVVAIALMFALGFLPLFNRRGHTPRCVGVKPGNTDIVFHNRAYAKLARDAKSRSGGRTS